MNQQNIDSELINQFIDEWKPKIASLQSETREVRYKKIDDGDEDHGVFLLGCLIRPIMCILSRPSIRPNLFVTLVKVKFMKVFFLIKMVLF